MRRILGDWDVARMSASLSHPYPLLSAEFKIMSMQAKRKTGLIYAYVITKDDDIIGLVDLFRKTTSDPFELGYCLAPEHWGHGYMSEACQSLMDAARSTLSIERMIANVWHDNPASIQILEKLDFQKSKAHNFAFSIARGCKVKSYTFENLFESA